MGTAVALLAMWVAAGQAQTYSIDWYKVAGGGGTSTGGVYSVSGTIGQADAGPTMSGGSYTLTGGFWSILQAVQTPEAPYLTVFRTETNTVAVWWPLPDQGWKLQYSGNLSASPVVWTEIPPPYPTNATACYYTEPLPQGNRFYRLHKP